MKSNTLLTQTICLLSLFAPLANALYLSDGTRHEEENVTYNNDEIYLTDGSFYQGRNITMTVTERTMCIGGEFAAGIHLTADEDKWNLFTATGNHVSSIALHNMQGTSVISRTKINHSTTGTGIQVVGTLIQDGSPNLILEDVEINMYGGEGEIMALAVADGASVTSNGGVSIKSHSDEHQFLVWGGRTDSSSNLTVNARIDLAKARLDLKKGIVITASSGTIAHLSNSTVISSSDNILIGSVGDEKAYNSIVTLDKVDLSQAVNQRIVAMEGHLVVNLTNETVFNGYVVPSATEGLDSGISEDGHITLNISAGGWKVSQSSNLGLQGELSLTNQSFLNLYALGGSDFTNINATAIMIQHGTVINLDVTAFDGGEGTYAILQADQFGEHNQATVNLIGAGNSPYIWDTSLLATEGTVTVRFNTIPEPATAALSFLGLAGLSLIRRRKF